MAIQDSMRVLQGAVNELQKCTDAAAGEMKGRKVKIASGKNKELISTNLPILEKQVIDISKSLNEYAPKGCVEELRRAITVLGKIRGEFKIEEYTGKLSVLKRFSNWISGLVTHTLYVGVGDKKVDIKGIEEKVTEVSRRMQETEKKAAADKAAQKSREEAARKVEEEAARKAAEETARKAAEDAKRQIAEMSFQTAASRGLPTDFQELKALLTAPEKPVFWVEKNQDTIEVRTLRKGKAIEGFMVDKDGKVSIDGKSYQNLKELQDAGFISLQQVSICRASALGMAPEKSDEKTVEKGFRELSSLVQSGQILCRVWKDGQNGIHVSVRNEKGEVGHSTVDFQASPGKAKFKLNNPPQDFELTKVDQESLIAEMKKGRWASLEILINPDKLKLSAQNRLQIEGERNKGFKSERDFSSAIETIPAASVGAYYFSESRDGKVELKVFRGMKEHQPDFSTYTIDLVKNPGQFTLHDIAYPTLGQLLQSQGALISPENFVARKKGHDVLLSKIKAEFIPKDFEAILADVFIRNKTKPEFQVWGMLKDQEGYKYVRSRPDKEPEFIPVVPFFDQKDSHWKVKVAESYVSAGVSEGAKTGYTGIAELAADLNLGESFSSAAARAKSEKRVETGLAVARAAGRGVMATLRGAATAVSAIWTGGTKLKHAIDQMWEESPAVQATTPPQQGQKPATPPVDEIRPESPQPPLVEEFEEEGVEEAAAAKTEEASEEKAQSAPRWLDQKIEFFEDDVGRTTSEVRENFLKFIGDWRETEQSSSEEEDLFETSGRYHQLVEGLRSHFSKPIKKESFEALQELVRERFSLIEKFQLYELADNGNGFLSKGATNRKAVKDFLYGILNSEKDEQEIGELKKYLHANSQRYGTRFDNIPVFHQK